MITGMHHFSIIASSEKSIEFYKSLGFTETFRKDRGYDTIVLMDGYGIGLEIFIDPTHPKRATKPENLGLRLLSLKVDNCEDLKKQYDCGPINKDWVGVKYCLTADPDGLPIQFHE